LKDKFSIAFYCSSLSWGGLEMNTLRHAIWMKQRGHEVCVYCVENSSLFEASKLNNIPVDIVVRNKKYFDFKNAKKLSRKLKSANHDLIWYRDNRDTSVVGLAKLYCGKRIKLMYQQAMQIGVDKKSVSQTMRFKRIDAWIAPLNYLKEQIKNKTKYPLDRVHVIPLAIDIERFQSNLPSKTDSKKSFGFGDSDIVVGIIGRIDPHKAQQFVKDTVVAMQSDYPNLKLLIVGNKTEGEWEDYYNQLSHDIEVNHSNGDVKLLPFMEDVGRFYQAIDIFIMASAKETFGMVTIEAMLLGKKIAGTNTFGTLELLNNENHGYYFVHNNKETLIKALTEIINKPDKACEKASIAQEYAKNNFSHLKECAQIEQVIKSIL
jgi:glycosyltransferase involved in cell wall biosynthesis